VIHLYTSFNNNHTKVFPNCGTSAMLAHNMPKSTQFKREDSMSEAFDSKDKF